MIELDGRRLRSAGVEAIARGSARVRLAEEGRARIRRAYQAARADTGPVYGRTTGVGANKNIAAGHGHGLRLLRSHAAGAGAPIPPDQARAMLAVRANQLAAGGAGVPVELAEALVEALNRGLTPPVRRIGAIGTGDLTALAVTALCLLGELPWQGGPRTAPSDGLVPGPSMPPVHIDDADALPFLSSSAGTIGAAALVCCDTDRLLRAMVPVAALSITAANASPEPFDPAVQAAFPHPGQGRVAALIRRFTAGSRPALARPRVQDSYAFRALPQVHGTALDAAARLDAELAVALNAAAENPLAGDRMLHNGNFHTAALAAAADGACAALTQAAALSAARLAALMDPAVTGLHAFLAERADDSSGALILEYVGHAALAELRGHTGAAAAAASGGVLSLGTEEHASFATQSVHRLAAAVESATVVAACELVAAVRALRLRGGPLPPALADWVPALTAALPAEMADRSLEPDLDAATALLPDFAAAT